MKDNRVKYALENIARRGVPEDINLMPHIAARLERKTFMTTLRTRPVMAALLALLILLAMTGAAYAIGKTLGYIPGVGLIENESGMRVLAEPVSVTREGVTLTVTQALVYPDHVQLIYEVSGIAPENNSATFSSAELSNMDEKAFCGPASSSRGGYLSDGDPLLRLPDGTTIDRVFDVEKYPENIFATKPAYETSIPADVTELTMLLKCIPWARLGAVPGNWEVPLKLKAVPAGTVIGQPVLEVTPSGTSSIHENGMTVSLDRVVPQEDRYSFYVSIVPDEKSEALTALYPASAYLLDATGQKTALTYNHPFSGSHDPAEPWELQTVSKPGYGPYTLVLDKIFAYHNTTSLVFEFDAGTDPQVGQVWPINQTVRLDGGDIKVLSAKMVEKNLADWGMSANSQGYEFTFEAANGRTPMQIDIMDFDMEHSNSNGMIVPVPGNGEPSTLFTVALYYEKGIPSGKIPVTINRQTILHTGDRKLQWVFPDQTGLTLLTQSIPSSQDGSGVRASLEKVVKLDRGYLFYLDMTALGLKPDLRVIEPGAVSVIDSTGKKISLQRNGPQVQAATEQNIWEFSTTDSIAEGPMQLVIENAITHYNPWDMGVPPTREMIADHSFTLDVGSSPQMDQTWDLNWEFELGGYRGKVISARAVPVDSQLLPFPELRPDASIDSGYEFTVQSLDPAVRWNVGISLDRSEGAADAGFVDCIGYLDGQPDATTTHTVTCRGLPDQILEATIYQISVQLNDLWKIHWDVPSQ